MKILITGGDGFIGRYVQSRCKELGIEVEVFDTGVDIRQDVTDFKSLEAWAGPFKPDAIIHLAGMLGTHELWDTAEDAIDVNIKGALNVARTAIWQDAKLVSIEQPHIWYNVYEATKFAARRMLTGLHYDEGLRVDFVTAHNAFGPGQAHGDGHPQKIIPTFATKAFNQEAIPIWGDGNQKVNLVYAGDVADALIQRALVRKSYPLKQFNAGSNKLFSVKDVADMVWEYALTPMHKYAKTVRLDMRKGEQDVEYPDPTGYVYNFKHWQLRATVDSYRPS